MAKPKQLELFVPTAPKQLWLMNFKNPLYSRFGKDFFSSIPVSPGVYKMKNERGEIIYVGKAKNLRNRLRSYTHANVENSSRKVLRLIELARTIEWEKVDDEKAALLRENHLLRTLAPYFNVVNTTPHTYLFAHLKLGEQGITLHLAMSPDESYQDIYGAFKGLGLTYRAHKAILRLLWMSYHDCRNGFELPSLLTNRRKLAHHTFELPKGFKEKEKTKLYRAMKRFFNGTSKSMLDHLIEMLLAREDLAGFTSGLIQQDIEAAHEFYKRCARRNRRIKKTLKLNDRLLAQDKIDDFIVIAQHQINS